MIPVSYTGFGPTAILLMVLCLIISQVFKYYKQKRLHRSGGLHLTEKNQVQK